MLKIRLHLGDEIHRRIVIINLILGTWRIVDDVAVNRRAFNGATLLRLHKVLGIEISSDQENIAIEQVGVGGVRAGEVAAQQAKRCQRRAPQQGTYGETIVKQYKELRGKR